MSPDPFTSTVPALAFPPTSMLEGVKKAFDRGAKTVGVIATFEPGRKDRVRFEMIADPPVVTIEEFRKNIDKFPPGASFGVYTKPPTVDNGRQSGLRRIK